jgi:cGMP-dependent protein kinase
MNKHAETDLEEPDERNASINKSLCENRSQISMQVGDRSRSRRVSERSTISQSNHYFFPNIEPTNPLKTSKDLDFIHNILSSHFLYSHLSKDQQILIISQIRHLDVPASQPIILQDKFSEYFWLIQKGTVEVFNQAKPRALLKSGDWIGQISLISNSLQTSTYKTIEACAFWILERSCLRTILQQVNSAEYAENKCFLESVPIFSILNKTQRELLLSSATTLSYFEQQVIVSEGDPGDLFFLIKEGQIECRKDGKFIRTMSAGEYFGEQAFLYGTPRTATVSSVTKVKCLAVSRDDLTKALGNQLSQIIYKNSLKMAFEKSRLISSLTSSQMTDLISKMTVQTFEDGEVVIRKGTIKSESMFVVLNGKLNEFSGTTSNIWQVLSILGEEELVKRENSCYFDVLASGRTDVASIGRNEFESVLGKIAGTQINTQLLSTFKKLYLFRSLSNESLKNLIENLRIEEFEENKTIFMQGSQGEAFYIIKQGIVDIYKDDVLIRSINKLDYFGERALLFDEPRSATVKTHERVECWVLKKSDFLQIIDERIRNLLHKRIKLQDTNVDLSDLLIIKKLGSGMLGEVFLTMSLKNNQLYALKAIDRHKIDNAKIQDNLMLERKILMQLDHCLILKLIKTFKDRRRVYFLLEYVQGADMFDVIRELGLLSNEDAKFYTCCLLIILEHLHEREIVYRDLKPENVMTDEEGYPKLIDFGTAKIVSGRTYTLIGTPHYMAPEVIMGKGYNMNADYWSLGIMIYEFMCGGVPFGEEDNDSYTIFEKILNGKVFYPPSATPAKEIQVFIEKLLSKNPALRIGGSYENLRSQAWIKDMDWEGLIEKKFIAPYTPDLPNLQWDINKAVSKKTMLESFPVTQNLIERQNSKAWDSEF